MGLVRGEYLIGTVSETSKGGIVGKRKEGMGKEDRSGTKGKGLEAVRT